MDILKMKDMKGGWFIGNFEPTAFKANNLRFVTNTTPKVKSGKYIFTKKVLK